MYYTGKLHGATNRPTIRASDDYYPSDVPSHGNHITDCAFNSLFLGLLGVADWDMFSTSGVVEQSGLGPGRDGILSKVAELHGMARALSGGPVYISDDVNPGGGEAAVSVDTVLLNRVIGSVDFSVNYPCKAALLPVRESLFSGAKRELLRMHNENAVGGVILAANIVGVGWDGETQTYVETKEEAGTETRGAISGEIKPEMVEAVRRSSGGGSGDNSGTAEFFCWFGSEKRGAVLKGSESAPITLEWMTSEVITVNEFSSGVAIVGFPHMYNSGGSVKSVEEKKEDNTSVIEIAIERGVEGNFLVAVKKGVEIKGVKQEGESGGASLEWERKVENDGDSDFDLLEFKIENNRSRGVQIEIVVAS